jgi:hypothetical protein
MERPGGEILWAVFRCGPQLGFWHGKAVGWRAPDSITIGVLFPSHGRASIRLPRKTQHELPALLAVCFIPKRTGLRQSISVDWRSVTPPNRLSRGLGLGCRGLQTRSSIHDWLGRARHGDSPCRSTSPIPRDAGHAQGLLAGGGPLRRYLQAPPSPAASSPPASMTLSP